MLETIREFGLERLRESGEADDVQRAHADHFLALAEAARPHYLGPEALAFLDRIEADLGNLRAALDGSLARGEATIATRLGGALWPLWNHRGHVSEGRGWLEEALRLGNGLPISELGEALIGASVFAFFHGDLARVGTLSEDLLARSRAEGYPDGVLWGLSTLGDVALLKSDIDSAMVFYEQARAVAPTTSSPLAYAAMVTGGLALTALQQGELSVAAAWGEEALALNREAGSPDCIACMLAVMGKVVLAQGDGERAA